MLRVLVKHLYLLSTVAVLLTKALTATAFTRPAMSPSLLCHHATIRQERSLSPRYAKTPQTNDDASPPPKKTTGLLGPQLRRSFLLSVGLAGVTNLALAYAAPPGYKRIPTQFIAALGDPTSSSGTNVSEWGLWTVDPGPRGVFLRDYQKQIVSRNDLAPAGWQFNSNDWWLEEHGLIMEAPTFPLPAGKYLVTGGRRVTTGLTVTGDGRWELEEGTLYDVTHLPCRSARYRPSSGGSPKTARERDFPVRPGAEMPVVEGCDKVDYAVLFVIGKEIGTM